MTIVQKIKMALAYKDMTVTDLARSMGTTPSAFNQRLKTDKFTKEELEKIARVLGADYVAEFRFPDGTRI